MRNDRAATLLGDKGFHALGLPSPGPGHSHAPDAVPRDDGRMAETDRPEDAYLFRTPMLRNVAPTAPYGHNGPIRGWKASSGTALIPWPHARRGDLARRTCRPRHGWPAPISRRWRTATNWRGKRRRSTWTVVELASGRERGPFDSEADVALCLASERVSRGEVEILSDVIPIASLTAWT